MTPVLPPGLEAVRSWMDDVETRLSGLEVPNQPTALYHMASTDLTATNAKEYVNCAVYLGDLNQVAYSSGSHWYKLAVGSLIV